VAITRIVAAMAALGLSAWALVPRQAPLDTLAGRALARIDGEIGVPHLRAPVRVVRD